jgi:hypothetical protein
MTIFIADHQYPFKSSGTFLYSDPNSSRTMHYTYFGNCFVIKDLDGYLSKFEIYLLEVLERFCNNFPLLKFANLNHFYKINHKWVALKSLYHYEIVKSGDCYEAEFLKEDPPAEHEKFVCALIDDNNEVFHMKNCTQEMERGSEAKNSIVVKFEEQEVALLVKQISLVVLASSGRVKFATLSCSDEVKNEFKKSMKDRMLQAVRSFVN